MIVLPILRMKISLSELEKCSLLLSDKILVEAKIRNLLAARATYEWLLFLTVILFLKQAIHCFLPQTSTTNLLSGCFYEV
jgi:hypothetical protein